MNLNGDVVYRCLRLGPLHRCSKAIKGAILRAKSPESGECQFRH
jgi:hypothetical protein